MIAVGRRDIDVRYDPIDRVLVPELIQGTDGVGNAEFHQVELLEGIGKYGFSPNEMPLRRTDIADSGIVVQQVTSLNIPIGSPLVQVIPPVGTLPAAGEYAVDINNEIEYLNTGRFIFNASNNGNYYRITYYGLGSINSVRNTKFIEDSALALKLSRDGSLPMTGNLNADSNKIINLANGTAAGDAINLSQLGNVQSSKGYAEGVSTLLPDLTITVTDDAFYYYLLSAVSGTTFIITGCPDVEKTIVFLEFQSTLGSDVEIHGNSIITGGTSFKGWLIRLSGIWIKREV